MNCSSSYMLMSQNAGFVLVPVRLRFAAVVVVGARVDRNQTIDADATVRTPETPKRHQDPVKNKIPLAYVDMWRKSTKADRNKCTPILIRTQHIFWRHIFEKSK